MFLFYVCGIIVTRHVGTPAQLQLGSYSTSEQATRYKWIDGKTIYRKTVSFGALPNATARDVPHGISGLDKIIEYGGISLSGSSVFTIPLVSTSNIAAGVQITVNATDINISVGQNRSAFTETYVTIYYTKT